MNISLVIDILILAALLYIAYKLYAIAAAITRFLERSVRDRDAREPAPAAQTINVNVASAPGGGAAQPGVTLAGPQSASRDASAAAESPAALGYSASSQSTQPAAEAAASERKAAPSGPFAVKCSRCHAENSSYRTECFNCGNPL